MVQATAQSVQSYQAVLGSGISMATFSLASQPVAPGLIRVEGDASAGDVVRAPLANIPNESHRFYRLARDLGRHGAQQVRTRWGAATLGSEGAKVWANFKPGGDAGNDFGTFRMEHVGNYHDWVDMRTELTFGSPDAQFRISQEATLQDVHNLGGRLLYDRKYGVGTCSVLCGIDFLKRVGGENAKTEDGLWARIMESIKSGRINGWTAILIGHHLYETAVLQSGPPRDLHYIVGADKGHIDKRQNLRLDSDGQIDVQDPLMNDLLKGTLDDEAVEVGTSELPYWVPRGKSLFTVEYDMIGSFGEDVPAIRIEQSAMFLMYDDNGSSAHQGVTTPYAPIFTDLLSAAATMRWDTFPNTGQVSL